MTAVPLIIAAHGTRDEAGAKAANDLVDRVWRRLGEVPVAVGFVELTPPKIDEAIVSVLDVADPVGVVVPLMVGDGGHVRDDIPEAIEAAKAAVPGARIAYGDYLGHDDRLVGALVERTRTALGDWTGDDVAVIVVGRGTLTPSANADHARLARLVGEHVGVRTEVGFIQVVPPDLSTALQRAADSGARRLVVVPNFLFPGRLRTWLHEQSAAWADGRDAEVRCAEVIGDCDELASVVIDRYRAAALQVTEAPGSDAYLTGLLLAGRPVLVVGGGRVNARRVPRLLQAGAQVSLVAPDATPDLEALAEAGARTGSGSLIWHRREFRASDIGDGAEAPWFVLAASDDPAVNAQVAELAEAAHTFCVRADDAERGSAFTPSVQQVGDYTVALLGSGTPATTKRARQAITKLLAAQIVADA